MPLPTESDVLTAIAALKSYQGLYINGVMSEDARMALQLMGEESSAAMPSETTFRADTKVNGSISANGATVSIDLGKFESSWSVQVTGTFVGILQTEVSLDGVNYIPVAYRQSQTGKLGNQITVPGLYRGSAGGVSTFRVRAIAWTSGTATITIAGGNVGAIFCNTIQEVRELAQYYATGAGGRVSFNITSGAVTVSTASMMILAFSNPVSSPVDLYIERITLSNATNGLWTRLRNATITPTGAPLVSQNRGGGDNLSESRSYLASSATITGGIATSSTHVGAYFPFNIEEDGALILRPGQNAVWSFAPVGGLGSTTASINIVYWGSQATI